MKKLTFCKSWKFEFYEWKKVEIFIRNKYDIFDVSEGGKMKFGKKFI